MSYGCCSFFYPYTPVLQAGSHGGAIWLMCILIWSPDDTQVLKSNVQEQKPSEIRHLLFFKNYCVIWLWITGFKSNGSYLLIISPPLCLQHLSVDFGIIAESAEEKSNMGHLEKCQLWQKWQSEGEVWIFSSSAVMISHSDWRRW